MISAFKAQGEHTTGTARAGMWLRSRGPFAIDIPEIKLGFTCSGHAPGSKEEELGSWDPGSALPSAGTASAASLGGKCQI